MGQALNQECFTDEDTRLRQWSKQPRLIVREGLRVGVGTQKRLNQKPLCPLPCSL